MLTFKEIDLQFKNARTEKDLPGIGRVWEYLAKRGINRATADQLGLFIVPAMELIAAAQRTPNIRVDKRAAIIFPHYSVANDESDDWWSARLVELTDEEPRLVASFGDLVDPEKRKKRMKMFCPPREAPCGYKVLGGVGGVTPNWGNIPHGSKIYIHESCIKAINGALLGKYSIGLNGVWGWASKSHDIALIRELKDLQWTIKELVPIIVFDAGARTNDDVKLAETRLAEKLFTITGRQALSLRVPHPEGTELDQGFDDYRVAVGDARALAFLDGDGEAIDVSDFSIEMADLNAKVCVVRSLGVVVEQETGTIIPYAKFTNITYSNRRVMLDDKWVRSARLWLDYGGRTEVEAIDYMPWAAESIADDKYNDWHGMGCEPIEGDVGPWLELVSNNVPTEKIRNWLISWFAWPLQNLGGKMNSLVLLYGKQGTGKGLVLKPIKDIYGKRNAGEIDMGVVTAPFNDVYAKKQLIHVDELPRLKPGDSGGLVMQKLKMLTTSDSIVVNKKGDPEYFATNCANIVLTANYHDVLKLDDDDRRVCVINWTPDTTNVAADHRGDNAYWDRYVSWANNGGAAALHQYLLEWDCAAVGFNPKALALHTGWKRVVTEGGMSPLEEWTKDLWDDPEGELPELGGRRVLWTPNELAVLYYGCSETEISRGMMTSLGRELANRGFEKAAGNNQIYPNGRSGKRNRFWVIRHTPESREDWQDPEVCLKHLQIFFK